MCSIALCNRRTYVVKVFWAAFPAIRFSFFGFLSSRLKRSEMERSSLKYFYEISPLHFASSVPVEMTNNGSTKTQKRLSLLSGPLPPSIKIPTFTKQSPYHEV